MDGDHPGESWQCVACKEDQAPGSNWAQCDSCRNYLCLNCAPGVLERVEVSAVGGATEDTHRDVCYKCRDFLGHSGDSVPFDEVEHEEAPAASDRDQAEGAGAPGGTPVVPVGGPAGTLGAVSEAGSESSDRPGLRPRDLVSDWESVNEERLPDISERSESEAGSQASRGSDRSRVTYVTNRTEASQSARFRREPSRPTDECNEQSGVSDQSRTAERERER